jgi:hypothetical protein
VAMDLALQAVQAGFCPAGDVVGERHTRQTYKTQDAERQASQGGKCCANAKIFLSGILLERTKNSLGNITNQTLSACCWKASLSDEPPSKRCVSVQ